jgi:hypothetical protein
VKAVEACYIVSARWRVSSYSTARRIIDELTGNFVPKPEDIEIKECAGGG